MVKPLGSNAISKVKRAWTRKVAPVKDWQTPRWSGYVQVGLNISDGSIGHYRKVLVNTGNDWLVT